MSQIFFNSLTVRGAARGVTQFRQRNQATQTDQHGKLIHCPLSFNALVPFPEEDLGIPLGGAAESLYHVLYSSDKEILDDSGVQRAGLKNRKALAAYFRKKDSGASKLAEQYRRNIEMHGHPTFFTWLPDKWGPNHDLGDGRQWNLTIEQPSLKELVYRFDTNWGVPDGWLMAVAKLFPKLEFTLAWECPDRQQTGLIRYRNGKQLSFVEREMWQLPDDAPDDPHGSYISASSRPPATPSEKPAPSRKVR